MYKYVAPSDDEAFAMASALAMTSCFPAPGQDGFTEDDARMSVGLLLCIPLTGEVSLRDAAEVVGVNKGRLGSALGRLSRRGIMSRRTERGETLLRMTGLGQSLARCLEDRNEDVVTLTWAVGDDAYWRMIKMIRDEGQMSVSEIQGKTEIPPKALGKAIEIMGDMGILRCDQMNRVTCDPEFLLSGALNWMGGAKPRGEEEPMPPATTAPISCQGENQQGENEKPTPCVVDAADLPLADLELLGWLTEPKATQAVADHLGVTRQRAQQRLSALEAAGHVTATQPRPRHSKFYQAAVLPAAKGEENHDMINPIAHSLGGPKALITCDHCDTSVQVRCTYEMKSAKKWKPDEGQILTRAKGLGWEMVKGKHYCPSCKDERRTTGKKDTQQPPILTVVPSTPAPVEQPVMISPPPHEPKTEVAEPRPVLTLSEIPKIEKETPMAAPTPIQMAKPATGRSPSEEPPREPTIAQNRLIRQLLDEVYDTTSERYTGGESDITVADTLKEHGVLPGWVARVRETFYGSGSGNEEEENLGAEITTLLEDISKRTAAVEEVVKKVVADLREIEKDRQKVKDLQTRFEKWKASLGPKGRVI